MKPENATVLVSEEVLADTLTQQVKAGLSAQPGVYLLPREQGEP
jgi:hypothetical protein